MQNYVSTQQYHTMNLRIKKKLGEGVMGTVYLSELNGQPTITKIEKYDNDLSTKSSFVRQKEFNDVVASKHPDRFLTLKFSGVQEDCKHVQKISEFQKEWPKHIQDYHKQRAKWKWCSILVYEPVLAHTLADIRHKLSDVQVTKIFKYLAVSIKIMNRAGYLYRDLHPNNIMCDKTMKKWYIIDYGAIWKPGYIKNIDDDRFEYGSDILRLLWSMIKNPVFNYMVRNNVRKPLLPPYKSFLKVIQADPRIKIIKKYIPKKVAKGDDWDALICCLLFYDLYIKAINADKLPIGVEFMKYKQPIVAPFLKAISAV